MLRRLLSFLCVVVLALSPARADFGSWSYNWGIPSASAACSSTPLTYLSSQTDTTDATNYTFSAVAIGNEPCTGNARLIYLSAGCTDITGAEADAFDATVGGIADTEIEKVAETAIGRYTAYVNVPTGTTADVFLDFGTNTCERVAVVLYALIVASGSTTPVDTVSDGSPSGDFDAANVAQTSGGGFIATLMSYPSSSCSAGTWSGADTPTTDVSTTLDNDISYISMSFTSSETTTTDDWSNASCGTETDGSFVVTSWSPPV